MQRYFSANRSTPILNPLKNKPFGSKTCFAYLFFLKYCFLNLRTAIILLFLYSLERAFLYPVGIISVKGSAIGPIKFFIGQHGSAGIGVKLVGSHLKISDSFAHISNSSESSYKLYFISF